MSELNSGAICPLPLNDYPRVLLAHGGGGRLMHQLIQKIFLTAFGTADASQNDAAVLAAVSGRLAFTTDSYVVSPLFFPGGDIGSLAVYGTVNDLATSGAKPLAISAGFILEEGLAMETLWRVTRSMAAAAERCGVSIVTGDTKVVERGKGDGLYINTTGIGSIEHELTIEPSRIQPGDRVIVSGDLGRHGAAIMAARESLGFSSTILSDCAPLADAVQAVLAADVTPRCIRDLTRGGLATVLNELAEAAGVGIDIDESAIAVAQDVAAFCEVLGLDPLYVANEGRMALVVPDGQVPLALKALRERDITAGAAEIGRVTAGPAGEVSLVTLSGASRLLPLLSGEQLPRIC